MKFKKIVFLVLGVTLVAMSASAGEIKYEGSSTVGKFITDASKVYKSADFVIDTVSESSGGEMCAYHAKCDIGGVARGVKQKFTDGGVVATLIGKDAIAAIVNVDNPVKELSTAQLRGIFTGKIKNWKEVGGEDLPIRALIVKETSATRRVFAKAILGDAQYEGTEVITPDNRQLQIIAKDRGAIGQLSFAFLVGNKDVKPLTIDGQEATVNNSDYPVTRSLHLTTKGSPTGEVKTFIDWAISAEGQKVVKQRFVGVK